MSLLDRHHALPDGGRIRLRIPHVSDRPQLRELLERLDAHDLDVRRSLHWAPRAGRWTVVATRWSGSREELVGLAMVDEASGGAPVLLADDAGVCDLLARALADRADTTRRRVA